MSGGEETLCWLGVFGLFILWELISELYHWRRRRRERTERYWVRCFMARK